MRDGCLLLCFINPRVRTIRKEASGYSCPGIFSRTLRCYFVASSPSSHFPHLHIKLVGCSEILFIPASNDTIKCKVTFIISGHIKIKLIDIRGPRVVYQALEEKEEVR